MFSTKSRDFVETILLKYLFTKKNKYSKYAVTTIFETLYPEVVESFRNMVCPFCGKKFTLLKAFYSHLSWKRIKINKNKAEPCYVKFKNIVDRVLEIYYDVVFKARHEGGHLDKKGKLYKLRDLNGVLHYFADLHEFSRFYVRNYVKVKAGGLCEK